MFTDVQIARFWSRVEKTPYCWNWIGALDKHGYGRATLGGKDYIAHRLAWFITHGLTTRMVRHACDNRRCVNPAHLYLADRVEPFVKRDKPQPKLDYGKARAIRIKRLRMHKTVRELSEEYGVEPQTIIDVLKRRTWK